LPKFIDYLASKWRQHLPIYLKADAKIELDLKCPIDESVPY